MFILITKTFLVTLLHFGSYFKNQLTSKAPDGILKQTLNY